MRILIVDDEPPARQRLHGLLDEIDGCEVVGEAANGAEALALSESLAPEIVLLDIRMPGIDGVEAAHHLAALDRPPAVIFTTAYDEYAVDAFDAQAVGYLMKPVRRERLERALRHAARLSSAQLAALAESRQERTSRRSHICARVREGLQLIPVEEVILFRADHKYTSVVHGGGEVLIDDSLKSLENEFDDDFVRIHRNSLVALAHLESVDRHPDGRFFATLRGHAEPLPVSRRLAPALRRRLRQR